MGMAHYLYYGSIIMAHMGNRERVSLVQVARQHCWEITRKSFAWSYILVDHMTVEGYLLDINQVGCQSSPLSWSKRDVSLQGWWVGMQNGFMC